MKMKNGGKGTKHSTLSFFFSFFLYKKAKSGSPQSIVLSYRKPPRGCLFSTLLNECTHQPIHPRRVLSLLYSALLHVLSHPLLPLDPAEVEPIHMCCGPHEPVVQAAAPPLLVRHAVDQGDPVRGEPLLRAWVDGWMDGWNGMDGLCNERDEQRISDLPTSLPACLPACLPAYLEVAHVGAEGARRHWVAGVALACVSQASKSVCVRACVRGWVMVWCSVTYVDKGQREAGRRQSNRIEPRIYIHTYISTSRHAPGQPWWYHSYISTMRCAPGIGSCRKKSSESCE